MNNRSMDILIARRYFNVDGVEEFPLSGNNTIYRAYKFDNKTTEKDYDLACNVYTECGGIVYRGLRKFSEDSTSAYLVLEILRDLGFSVFTEEPKEKGHLYVACGWDRYHGEIGISNENISEAICNLASKLSGLGY